MYLIISGTTDQIHAPSKCQKFLERLYIQKKQRLKFWI